MVKECSGCQLAAEAQPIEIQPWLKTDVPWTRLQIDYAGPLNGYYYLIIVDSFSKWPEIFKCRHPTSTITVNVLNELFCRFGTPKTLVIDKGTQFIGREFKDFSTSLSIDHITISVYHSRSNGHAERFVDPSRRPLKKNQGMVIEERSKQVFSGLQNYAKSEHRFRHFTSRTDVRKINSVSLMKKLKTKTMRKKIYKLGVFFWNYGSRKSFWEDGIITKRLSRVIHMLKGRRFECKRHLNQLRPRYIKDIQKDREELPMEIIYDAFKIPVPISPSELMKVSFTSPVLKIPAPRKLLIPQITPEKNVTRQESIRKEKVK